MQENKTLVKVYLKDLQEYKSYIVNSDCAEIYPLTSYLIETTISIFGTHRHIVEIFPSPKRSGANLRIHLDIENSYVPNAKLYFTAEQFYRLCTCVGRPIKCVAGSSVSLVLPCMLC
jgi:hypothetical protein